MLARYLESILDLIVASKSAPDGALWLDKTTNRGCSERSSVAWLRDVGIVERFFEGDDSFYLARDDIFDDENLVAVGEFAAILSIIQSDTVKVAIRGIDHELGVATFDIDNLSGSDD